MLNLVYHDTQDEKVYQALSRRLRDEFELRYKETIDPDKNRWELCSRVLASKDVVEKLSESW